MRNWQGENSLDINKSDSGQTAKKLLDQYSYFAKENFIDANLCDSISSKALKFLEGIDVSTSNEHSNYKVMCRTEGHNPGSAWMDSQSKSCINVRQNTFDGVLSDTNFLDMFNPNIVFEEVEQLKNHEFFKSVSKAFGKDPAKNHCNLYYSNSITDTRTWHVDSTMAKMFVYLTDVTDDNYGPYAVVPESHNKLDKYLDRTSERQKTGKYNECNEDGIKFLGKKGTIVGSYQHALHRGISQFNNYKRLMFVYKIYLR